MSFVVGIDLGTTRSALAYSPADRPEVRVFEVPQLVEAGQVAARPLLPSAVYLPAGGELAEGATRLPWGAAPEAVVGVWAEGLGAKVPGRLVASAKSWLSHAGVDRGAALLPWGAPAEAPRLSPVEASAAILSHLRAAWDQAHPEAPLADQEVVLTVPASFDEVARELTVTAARTAGLPRLRLLEEPQAAFYDYLREQGDALGEVLAGARLALVVDVGGGTTDLTLVRIDPQAEGPPRLERVAVGAHLMLGGDNMDLALAHHVERALEVGRLDPAQWSQLIVSARQAKERLLGPHPPKEARVTLAGRGARLLGASRSHALDGDEATRLLLDGFLPRTRGDEVPSGAARAGLAELGLPYARDPAISRHLAAFLRRHLPVAAESGVRVFHGLPRPDVVLLNGGVFNAPAVVARLSEVMAGWFEGEPVPLLTHGSLDLAVARGAAWYGLVRRGFGARIGGGSPRSYFVGVEAEEGGARAVCVVPRGLEEGETVRVKSRPFRLRLGRPVTFPLYASTGDRRPEPGEVVPVDEELEPLPPLHTILEAPGEGGEIPVTLEADLTEIGTLELSLARPGSESRRWRLAFAVRGEDAAGGGAPAPTEALPRRFEEAREALERVYGTRARAVEPREVKKLWRTLEGILGPRDRWTSAVARELWGVVWAGQKKRRRTADHERIWFQLAGWCLRPGFGAPLDDWRARELWESFPAGVQYTTEKPNWAEWWILWRRVAGGLDQAAQTTLLEAVRPWIAFEVGQVPRRPKGPRAHGVDEMIRMLASLERLSAAAKVEAAGWVLARLERVRQSWWPLGRLGARQPFHGSAHDVVPTGVAEDWLERVLALDWAQADGAAFAAAELARRTGDRARDVDAALAERVAIRLEASSAPPAWARMVREVVHLEAEDEGRIFGDTLPVGLALG